MIFEIETNMNNSYFPLFGYNLINTLKILSIKISRELLANEGKGRIKGKPIIEVLPGELAELRELVSKKGKVKYKIILFLFFKKYIF